MSLDSHIDELQKSAHELIEELKEEFPDLEVDTDRWKRTRYMAKSANSRVDQVMFHRNCGCCDDSPHHARPYLEYNGVKIYSDPCNAMIGEAYSFGGGFKEYDHWETTYTKAGINPVVIQKIRQYIESHS